jgi:hypothetical protein
VCVVEHVEHRRPFLVADSVRPAAHLVVTLRVAPATSALRVRKSAGGVAVLGFAPGVAVSAVVWVVYDFAVHIGVVHERLVVVPHLLTGNDMADMVVNEVDMAHGLRVCAAPRTVPVDSCSCTSDRYMSPDGVGGSDARQKI